MILAVAGLPKFRVNGGKAGIGQGALKAMLMTTWGRGSRIICYGATMNYGLEPKYG